MSLEFPDSYSQPRMVKLKRLLTAFSLALMPASLILSSPVWAQNLSSYSSTSDIAGILIAAKGPEAPSTELAEESDSEKSSDSKKADKAEKKSTDKKSDDKKSDDKKAKAKADSKDEKAKSKDDKAKEEKSGKDKDKDKSKDKPKDKEKKSEAKSESKEDNKDDAKKAAAKRGFFGRAKEEPVKEPAKAAAPATPVTKEAEKKAETKAESKEERLVFEPDTALISVLKDLNRSLKDGDEISKIEDANQRMIVGLAANVLDKALSEPKLSFNRILAKEQENKARTRLTAESWSSGDVEINDKFHGSLSSIWAKRIDGLVTVTIAGDCHDRKAADGKDVGEFIVVISARSPVETGFDIQSQANVNFWIGKLGNITVEADCIPKPAPESEEGEGKEADSTKVERKSELPGADQKKKPVALPPLLTHRYRHYYEMIVLQDDRRRQIAQQLAMMDPSIQLAAQKEIVEVKETGKTAKLAKETNDNSDSVGVVKPVKAVKADESEKVDEKKPEEKASETPLEKSVEKSQEKKEDPVLEAKQEVKLESTKDSKQDEPARPVAPKAETVVSVKEVKEVREVKATIPAVEKKETAIKEEKSVKAVSKSTRPLANQGYEMAYAGAAQTMERITGLELPALKQPKNFTMLMPERALAGQPLTVAFVDDQRNPESNVELSFNGVTLSTDQNGQAQYLIPEDETPGRSLNIALLSRPYEMPAVVEVIQPLATPSSPQAPKIDRASHLVSRRSNLVIDGHNFDGVANNNRVIIDGVTEATIAASSPVQLKVTLPRDLKPGPHSLCVSTEGMRSNPTGFELAQLEVLSDGSARDNATKVTIKVIGTTSKVNVKLVNLSPELIRLTKGDDIKLLSSGGLDNTATVTVQRLKKGPMKVEAWLDL